MYRAGRENCARLVENSPSHSDQIIIAVDGGCRNNGRPDARASIGVFFAPDSEENFASVLSFSDPRLHTSQTAELNACQYALDAALHIFEKRVIENISEIRGTLTQVVIKTDSEHLYLGMTERVFKWEKNGWLTSTKNLVAHRSMFKQLQRSIADLEDVGVEVLYWWVPRERNRDADALASSVLY
jgi:ribonuclease HI